LTNRKPDPAVLPPSYFVLEPKPSSESREEREKRMDELTRKYVETRDPEIREELYRLGHELEKMKKQSKS
jgi:hypothetical protein